MSLFYDESKEGITSQRRGDFVRKKSAASPLFKAGPASHLPGNTPITYDLALEIGMWITQLVGSRFYASNRVYAGTAIDEEDLIAHLRHYILTARYLTTVEKNPEYYTLDSYRKSLYTSCLRTCFAHFRKHVTAQKRGYALKPGVTVSLDADYDSDENVSLASRIPESTTRIDHHLTRTTGCCLIDRCLAYIQYGGTWNDLSKILPLSEAQRRQLEAKLQSHILEYA